jgi:dihydroorotate dehydrogenase (NAD+) catalytic subunit
MGGIASGSDGIDFLAAGATALALGTVLFSDPGAPSRVRLELHAEAAARGYASPAELSKIVSETRTPATPSAG